MKLTATAGIDIDPGMYDATLLGIEEMPPSPEHPEWGPQYRWNFHVYSSDEGVEMPGYSSVKMTPGAKARRWIEALIGRRLEPGEGVDPDDICPANCQVLVKKSTKSDFMRIDDVLPARKKGKSVPAKPTDSEDDGIPL